MFSMYTKLIKLELSNFDVSKVENIKGVFGRCKSLIELNLINFNTNNCSDMRHIVIYFVL